MRNRRTSPYLIYSLVIHIILLLGVWWLAPQQVPVLPFYDEIEVSIRHVERPPLPIEPPKFVEPAAPVVVEKEKPKPPPKPKAGLSAAWELDAQDVTNISEPETRKQENASRTRQIGDGLSQLSPVVGKPTDYASENRLTVNALDQPTVTLPSTPETDYVPPQGETNPIALDADDTLNVNSASPTVDAPKIHYGSERGDALRATGMGNAWGGGSTSGGANIGGAFVYMMKDIARELAAASTTESDVFRADKS